jgi:hypothetical protein
MVDHPAQRLIDLFMEEYRGAGIIPENGIEEKFPVLSCPYTFSLILRIQIQLTVMIEINKPAHIAFHGYLLID